MRELQGLQDSNAKEEKDRAASYEKKLKDLQTREAERARKEQQSKSSKGGAGNVKDTDKGDQAKKEADIQRKLDDLKSTEEKVAADRAALDKARSDLSVREKEIQQRQKELEDRESSAKQDATLKKTQNATNGSVNSDLEKKHNDNARLEQRLSSLEAQLAQMNGTSQKKPQANGTGDITTSSDAGSIGCGQKHYKPPRKLNRKVIGLVYQ